MPDDLCEGVDCCVGVYPEYADSDCVPDADLFLGALPLALLASELMSMVCVCKLCLVRGKLRSDTECRLVRRRFSGRTSSASWRDASSSEPPRSRFRGAVEGS